MQSGFEERCMGNAGGTRRRCWRSASVWQRARAFTWRHLRGVPASILLIVRF